MKPFTFRIFLVLVFPFIFVYSVLVELIREQRHALHMTWLHARGECWEFGQAWKRGSPR